MFYPVHGIHGRLPCTSRGGLTLMLGLLAAIAPPVAGAAAPSAGGRTERAAIRADPAGPPDPLSRAGSGVRTVTLHVDPKALEDAHVPDEPLVSLTEAEYRSLVAAYDRGSAAAEAARRRAEEAARPEEPALPSVIRSVRVIGEAGALAATLAATFQVAVGERACEPIVVVPGSEAALAVVAGARLPDAADRLRADPARGGRALVYVPTRAGPREVGLDLAVPVHTDRSRRSLVVPLPGAFDQVIDLKLPAPASGVTITPAWLPLASTPVRGGGLAVRVTAGGVREVTVGWMAHAATPAARPVAPRAIASFRPAGGPRLFATLSTLHSIGDGIVRFHSWIDLVNSRDRIASVDVELPLRATLRQVSGPIVKSFEVSPRGGDAKRLHVAFSEAFRGRTRIEIDGEIGFPVDAREPELLPLPVVTGAVRAHHAAGVSAFATYRVQFADGASRDVSPMDVSELPSEILNGSPSPVLLAFRCSSAGSRLAIQLSRFKPNQRLMTTVEGVNAVTVLSPTQVSVAGRSESRIRTYSRLVLKVANAGEKELQLTLPGDAQIESCFVDLVPQVPARMPVPGGGVTYLVPLKLSPVAGNRLVPYPVEIAYRHDLPRRMALRETVDLEFPRWNAPSTDINWSVYTPEGLRTVDVAGTFHLVADEADLLLVTHGQTVFELVVCRGGRLACLLLIVVGLPIAVARRWLRRSAGMSVAGAAASGGQRLPGVSVAFLAASLVGIALLSGIAVPNFKAARERSNTRACYANQKTVVGAVEMYNLDKNTKVDRLTPEFWKLLKGGGYLQSVPADPGEGPQSTHHYELTADGNGIRCLTHGGIQ
jgi:competence protein ComGC